jgi:hypothetical protein
MSVLTGKQNGVKKSVLEKWGEIIDGFQKTAYVKPSKREAMAQVLETEMKYLPRALKENSSSIGNFLTTTGTSALGTVPFYIGVIRRGYPKLIGMNLFGVTALKQPGGVVFAIKRTLQGSEAQQKASSNSIGQLTTFNSRVLVLDKELVYQPTGSAALDIAIVDTESSPVTKHVQGVYADDKFVLVTINGAASTAADTTWLDAYATGGTFVISGVTYTISSVLENQDLFTYIFKKYSTFFDQDTSVQNDDFAGDRIREVGSDIIKIPIEHIKSRKIKSKISQEVIEDMNAYGHDIQNDLMNLMMEDVTGEMNREFLGMINDAAETPLPAYDFAADTDDALKKYVKIVSKATLLSNKIAQDLKSGIGNYMVVTTGILSAFTALSKYWFSTNPTISNLKLSGNEFASDPFVSKFNDWWNLYVDVFAQTNYGGTYTENVTVGYYSDNNMDNAFFFLPYIALVPDVMKDPNDGQWRIIYRTRYATLENPFGAKRWIKKLQVTNFSI